MYVKRPLHHPSRRKIAEYTAALCGVTLERFLAVVKARKAYRLARFHRERSRRRSLERNKNAKPRPERMVRYAGEGEMDELLRQAGLTKRAFCELADLAPATVKGWSGHPMRRTPIVLLEYYLYAKRMEEFMRSKGWDPHTMFWPKPLPPAGDGRYPRTTEQGKALLEGLE